MKKRASGLTDAFVFKLRNKSGKVEKHYDRDGLYLSLTAEGRKAFRYEFRFPPTTNGTRQTLTFGRYPELSLAQARERHVAARRLLAEGINPAAEKQEKKRALIEAYSNTYEAIARQWYEQAKGGKSATWLDNNTRWLEMICKRIGSKPITAVTRNDVLFAVDPLKEAGKAFSAERARRQAASVFAYAISEGVKGVTHNPGANARGKIRVPKAKSHRFIGVGEIPAYLEAVDSAGAKSQQSKHAARLLLLTLVRKMELMGAKKSEFDLERGLWEIPAERMKMDSPHIVPLSSQALELFRAQFAISGNSEFVFPNLRGGRGHAGESTLNTFLIRVGFADRLTPHGLRHTASTYLNGSEMRFRPDVIERQLAHLDGSVRGIYNKADYLPERKRLLQHWADVCDGRIVDSSNVIALQPKAAA